MDQEIEHSVALQEPVTAEIEYISYTDVTQRKVRFDAVAVLPSGEKGLRGFCKLRGEMRSFHFRGIRRMNVSSPANFADASCGHELKDMLKTELSALGRLVISDKLSSIDDDPRLVILAAVGRSAIEGTPSERRAVVAQEIRSRIQSFMERAVRWVSHSEYCDLVQAMTDALSVDDKRLSRAIRKVHQHTRDEIFFEASGLALLTPNDAAMRILKAMHDEFNETSGKRPPPWHRQGW